MQALVEAVNRGELDHLVELPGWGGAQRSQAGPARSAASRAVDKNKRKARRKNR